MATVLELPKEFHPDFAVKNRAPKGPVVLNYGNNLTKGLSGFGINNLGIDVVNKQVMVPTSGITYQGTPQGSLSSATSGGSTNYLSCATVTSGAVQEFTIFVHFVHKSDSGNKYNCGVYSSKGVGITPINGAGNPAMFFNTTQTSASAALTVGREYVIVGRRLTGSGSQPTKLWVNGEEAASSTVGNFTYAADQGFVFNNISDTSIGFGSTSHVISAGFYRNRALASKDVVALSKDLYGSLLNPAVPLQYFIPAAVGGLGIPIAAYHHNHNSGSSL